MLNLPRYICNLDRDKLHRVLGGIDGLEMPATIGVARAQLLEVSHSALALSNVAIDLAFPVIVRPRGSHAGVGLGVGVPEGAGVGVAVGTGVGEGAGVKTSSWAVAAPDRVNVCPPRLPATVTAHSVRPAASL